MPLGVSSIQLLSELTKLSNIAPLKRTMLFSLSHGYQTLQQLKVKQIGITELISIKSQLPITIPEFKTIGISHNCITKNKPSRDSLTMQRTSIIRRLEGIIETLLG